MAKSFDTLRGDPGWRPSDFTGSVLDDEPELGQEYDRRRRPKIDVPGFPQFDHSVYPIPDADWEALGPRAREILEQLLPEFAGRFAQAALHYGDNNADNLGPAGQFADIWRKIGPLRRALWDGEELTRESAEVILFDLIGHCLLTIGMLRREVDRRGAGS